MAIQILPREENQYGRLSELLGMGLGSGLGNLAKIPFQKAEKQKNIQSLKGLGFSEDEANAIADQPANVQQDIIRNRIQTQSQLMAQQQKLQQQNQNNALFGALLSGDTSSLNQLLGGLSAQQPSQMPLEQTGLTNDQRLQLGSQLLSPQQYSALEKSIRSGEKLQLQRESQERSDIKDRQKAFAKERSDINKQYKDYKRDTNTLNEMEKLISSGKLSNPAYVSLLRKVGLDIPALMSNEDVTFIKLRNEFLPTMKNIYGGRVTNLDLEQFLKGLPDLTQTDEGKKKLIDILKLTNESKKVYHDALKEVERKYGDKIPYNASSLINDIASKKMDDIGERLNELYDFTSSSQKNISQEQPFLQQASVTNLSNNNEPNIGTFRSPQGQSIANAAGGIARQVVRPAIAAGSSILSTPRNLVDIATSVIPEIEVADIPEDVRKMLPEDSIKQIEEYRKNPQPMRSFLRSVGEYLPSQDQIKKALSHYLPEGYVNPQNATEEFIDDVVSDVASLMTVPGAAARKSLITAGLGNIAKVIPKSLGFSPAAQEGAKIGAMMLTSMGLGPNLKDTANNLYTQAEGLATGKRLPADNIIKTANNIEKKYLSSGLNTEDKKVLSGVIDQIKERVPSQHVKDFDLKDIWQIKKDMVDPIDNVRKGSEAQKYLFELRNAVDTSLKNSPNKEFSTLLSRADKIYEGIKNASSVNKFVNDSFKKHGIVLGAAGIPSIIKALYANPLGTIAAVGLPWAGANNILMLNNILKNNEVRKEYAKFIAAATKNNAPALIRSARKLEKQSK